MTATLSTHCVKSGLKGPIRIRDDIDFGSFLSYSSLRNYFGVLPVNFNILSIRHSYMWCVTRFGTICNNFKNVKNTHGGELIG